MRRPIPICLIAGLLMLLAPSGAAAATIVNGDFESGTLNGWHVHGLGAGNWFAYEGTDAPIGHQRGADPVQAPPQGEYAAIADQANPDTSILYQDVALEAGSSYRLSLLAYYDSYEPIAIPTPDTLSVEEEVLGGQTNQQFRIDVIKPNAPLATLDPADILRTLFHTELGDPLSMQPSRLTTDLSPFAGQRVRLRIATAVHEEVLNAGVDAVSLVNTAAPGDKPSSHGKKSSQHGSNRLGFGKAKANRQNGTVVLPVRVSGPGVLTARGKSSVSPSLLTTARKGRRPGEAIKPVTVKVSKAGTVRMRLKPTPSSRAILAEEHKLRVKVKVTYKPTGDSPETASLPVVFKLKARARGGH